MEQSKRLSLESILYILFRFLLLTCLLTDGAVFAQEKGVVLSTSLPSKRVALVVGNNAYPKMPLENAVNDARAMQQTLIQLGFESQKVEDATLINLEKAVNAFIGRLGPGDVGLFFYAGHGIQVAGENYLVPVDFDAEDETVAKYKSFPAEMVRERMENAGTRLSIIVLDACRNNPFRTSRSASRGLAAMNSGRGTLIAFATGPGKTASDSSAGKNGLFTHHLIASLRMPGLSLDDVFNRVRTEVDKESSHEQTPWVVSSVIGTFRFTSDSSAPAPAAAETAAPKPTAPIDYSDLEQLAVKRRQWKTYMENMSVAYSKARNMDELPELTPPEKVQVWQRFVNEYKSENPYDDEDDRMRGFAYSRIREWKERPTSSSIKPGTTPAGPKQEPPAVPPEVKTSSEPSASRIWQEPVSGMEFVWIVGGCFQMGCGAWAGECFDDERPVHEVCVDGFWMAKSEVTQGQWKRVMGVNPSGFQANDSYPVEMVSWDDAAKFIARLKSLSRTPAEFRLPTEAEWEYACRSGGKSEKYPGGGTVDQVTWYDQNSAGVTHPVGSKLPNGLGLFDMSGNVREWCADIYTKDAYTRHSRKNPLNMKGGSERVVRGGCWYYGYKITRCGNRYSYPVTKQRTDLGFRLVKMP